MIDPSNLGIVENDDKKFSNMVKHTKNAPKNRVKFSLEKINGWL